MLQRRVSFAVAVAVILGVALLMVPTMAIAQHHGGHGMGGSVPGGSNRPTGLDEKDSLKDFHQALAMQATSQQIAEFGTLMKYTEAAQSELQAFLQPLRKENGAAEAVGREALDKALETARDRSKKFQEGFSSAQKSGLKDIVKRLTKADSDLEQAEKRLDQSVDVKAARPEVAAHAESLDKVLADFRDQQLALGREMSIVLATGEDLAFTLPQVKSPVNIENRTIAVTVSGVLSQTAAQGGQRTFKLELISDLSDLQQNIT